MTDLNVWVVFWRRPDGKPFIYDTHPKRGGFAQARLDLRRKLERRAGSTKLVKARSMEREPKERLFDTADVTRFKTMVTRVLPHAKFRCLTNVGEIPGVETVPLQCPDCIAWWAKMELFRPGMPPGRNLYFDLDTIALKGIQEIADVPAPFAVMPGMSGMERSGKPWEDMEGRWRVPLYQTSCMVWDTPAAAMIWKRFSPDVWSELIRGEWMARLASDQDFIGEQFPKLFQMERHWFVKLRTLERQGRKKELKVVLTMIAHNDGAVEKLPWLGEFWPPRIESYSELVNP